MGVLRRGLAVQNIRARRAQLMAALTQVERRRHELLEKVKELDSKLAALAPEQGDRGD